MDSIMQENKECYITKSTLNLHKHHIFGAANRNNSEKYGLWIWLKADWHNMADYGIHFNKPLREKIQKEAQQRFNEVYPDLNFLKIFGRNYL